MFEDMFGGLVCSLFGLLLGIFLYKFACRKANPSVGIRKGCRDSCGVKCSGVCPSQLYIKLNWWCWCDSLCVHVGQRVVHSKNHPSPIQSIFFTYIILLICFFGRIWEGVHFQEATRNLSDFGLEERVGLLALSACAVGARWKEALDVPWRKRLDWRSGSKHNNNDIMVS